MKLFLAVVATTILLIAGCNARSDHPVFVPAKGAFGWQIEAEIKTIRELPESRMWGLGLDETGFGIDREGARLLLGYVHATQKRVSLVSGCVEKSNGTSQQKTRWKQEIEVLDGNLKMHEWSLKQTAGN